MTNAAAYDHIVNAMPFIALIAWVAISWAILRPVVRRWRDWHSDAAYEQRAADLDAWLKDQGH